MARYGNERRQAKPGGGSRDVRQAVQADGIDSSGIATLMADAGLTNGAFYAHFASKDNLVATAVADQLREQRERFSALAPGRAGVEQYVREYLSIQHRDRPGEDGHSPACSTRSGIAPVPSSRPTPTACWPSSTTSTPAWRRTIRSRHASRRSAYSR